MEYYSSFTNIYFNEKRIITNNTFIIYTKR